MPSKHSAYGRGARPRQCRECGVPRSDEVHISARGLCLDCSADRQIMAGKQLVARKGPHYEQWVRSSLETAQRAARQL